MPVFSNIAITKFEDTLVTITISGGYSSGNALQLQVRRHFASESGLIVKSMASGYIAGESGLTQTNPLSGLVGASFLRADTSGLDPDIYSYDLAKTTSGRLVLNNGFWELFPPIGTP